MTSPNLRKTSLEYSQGRFLNKEVTERLTRWRKVYKKI